MRRIDLESLSRALQRRGPGRVVQGLFEPERPPSAVLVPLYLDGDDVTVVLTRRAAHLRSHRGEVSFPGGRVDDTDESLWHTAVREASEEIGLDARNARRLGELDRFVTVGSRSLVHPFVALVDPPTDLVPAPDEVEHILHVPLNELLLDEVFREERWAIGGAERPITFFELDGDTVWGATAAMLRQLLAIGTGTLSR